MPELAEVAYYRARWDPGLGHPITRVHIHPHARIFRDIADPGSLPDYLSGRTFRASFTHGKNLLFHFGGGQWLGGHLGMTGKLSAEKPGHKPRKHDHLVLFQKRQALVFSDPRMFGKITFDRGNSPPAWWRELPPEILSKDFNKNTLAGALNRRPRSPIKPLLLDQSLFPGIGNWMADEILWRCQIHPATLSGDLLEKVTPLWQSVRTVSRQAMKVIAPNWSRPPDSWLFNHRWTGGGHCPRCRNPLTRESLRGRTTCYCPGCQTGP